MLTNKDYEAMLARHAAEGLPSTLSPVESSLLHGRQKEIDELAEEFSLSTTHVVLTLAQHLKTKPNKVPYVSFETCIIDGTLFELEQLRSDEFRQRLAIHPKRSRTARLRTWWFNALGLA